MFGEEGSVEGAQCGEGEVDDDDLGGDMSSRWSSERGYRDLRAAGAGLVLGAWAKTLEEELFVEPSELAVGGDSAELVAEIQEHAVVSGGVVGEGDAELTGHERGFPAAASRWVEAGEQLVAGGVVEGESSPDARAERERVGRAESLGQSRVAGEDDAEQLLAIEIFAGQDA